MKPAARQNHHGNLPTVVLMGAESTGKTTLAEALAQHYKTVWVAEYLRIFVDEKGSLPEEKDVHAIARGHLELVTKMRSKANKILFLDTDLFTTCVYQRMYFDECPDYIEHTAREHQAELYLFTEPDIPWVSDPGQRASLEERLRSHRLLSTEARAHSLNTIPVCGSHAERLKTAVKAVDHYIRGYAKNQ